MSRLAAILFVAVLTAGCSPQLMVVTPAPPNRIVRLDQEADRIEVSEGVAVALECRREGMPCKDVRATVDDGSVAHVYPAHMNKLDRGYLEQGNVSTMAIVGLAPGRTKVRVTAERWTHDYELTVHANASPAR